MIRSAKARARPQRMKPRGSAPRATSPVISAFSVRLMSGAAAWPSRSSGAASSPSARRASGRSRPMSPAVERASCRPARSRSPDSAASSSSWPLPATPPMPEHLAGAQRRSEMSRKRVPNRRAAAGSSPITSSSTAPALAACALGHVQAGAHHHLGQLRARSARADRRSPPPCRARSTVASSHRLRISSSLWLM